ncbi:hypothetical protein Acsp03_16330 [Actinomadura sp. NBRC 104412]|nr:hypothetical protein Acsp03_16330 [Actinomadura sp. NBRC 104412]
MWGGCDICGGRPPTPPDAGPATPAARLDGSRRRPLTPVRGSAPDTPGRGLRPLHPLGASPLAPNHLSPERSLKCCDRNQHQGQAKQNPDRAASPQDESKRSSDRRNRNKRRAAKARSAARTCNKPLSHSPQPVTPAPNGAQALRSRPKAGASASETLIA